MRMISKNTVVKVEEVYEYDITKTEEENIHRQEMRDKGYKITEIKFITGTTFKHVTHTKVNNENEVFTSEN